MATPEDQQQINQFARLHKSYLEVKAEIRSIHVAVQNIDDAENDLLLMEDEVASSIPFQIGSIFVHYDRDTAESKLTAKKEENEKRIAALADRQGQLVADMDQLKSKLYAKFGDNIHLEMEVED